MPPNVSIRIHRINQNYSKYGIDGFFDKNSKAIYIDEINENLCHELIHFILDNNKIKTSLYAEEAMAEMFKKPMAYHNVLNMSIVDIRDFYFTTFTELTAEKCGINGLFFRFISENYSAKKLLAICQKSQGLDDFFGRLETLFGSDVDQITKDFCVWRKNINEKKIMWYGVK